ncbi:MAG: hypothetical protein QNJ51_03065 [Calothrix sp. MO_167.B12]|nr:hypothetical protein [Calothrix sp. MO_167.B12]
MNHNSLCKLLSFDFPKEVKAKSINKKFYLYFPSKKDVIYIQEFDESSLIKERFKYFLPEYFEIEGCTYHVVQNHPDYVKSATGVVAFSYENAIVTKNSCVFKKSNTNDMGLTFDEIKKFMMNVLINIHYENTYVELIR